MTRLDSLLIKRPMAFHVTYATNVKSILKNGLHSAANLKSLSGREGKDFRNKEVTLECDGLGKVVLRDQYPMRPDAIRGCLPRSTPEDWYEFIDKHIFFFLDEARVDKLLRKYTDQVVLEVPTHELVPFASHVTPINTGAVGRARAERDENSFHSIESWNQDGFTDRLRKRAPEPVELVLRMDTLKANLKIRRERQDEI